VAGVNKKKKTVYSAYLEIDSENRCMAHVLDLPGCTARGMGREAALSMLRQAIRDYHAWLRGYGEPAPSPSEPIEVEVVEERAGLGPFNPGDAASLFTLDRKPLTHEEMETYFRLMAYTRGDLLDLVHHLPDEALDWKPDPQSFTIRRLLRHTGNAEEWYVSRLVPVEALPPEWEHDEALPILEFLEMERRTSIDCLRRLSEVELTEVFYQARWTSHPEEPWTLRKVLRRFLEHEREHTAQAKDLLADYLKRTASQSAFKH